MKERLTGAFILVGLVVVLVPELLSGPIRPASRTHGPASSAEEPPLRSYTISLADEPHGGSGSLPMQAASSPPAPAADSAAAARAPAAAPPAAPAALTRPAPTPTPATPTATTRTAPAPSAAPPTAASPAAGMGAAAYVVQLGSFASRANAERLAKQVRGLGFTVSVSRGSSGRHLYRVQVGPAREHGAAEELAAQLRAKGHGGTVVPK